MDVNPFAPPRTTDLELHPAEAPTLEPAAIEALISGGRWAHWAAVLGALGGCLSLFKLATGRQVVVDAGVGDLGVVSLLVSLVVAWQTWRFAAATRHLPGDEQAVEDVTRTQHHLFVAYAVLGILMMSSGVIGIIVGFRLGRATGS